ncbi:replication-relaxation family protein [Streptomyces sp. NPDC002835]
MTVNDAPEHTYSAGSTTSTRPGAIGETSARRALALLGQHRLLTTAQVHIMLSPHAGRRVVTKRLAALEAEDLVGRQKAPTGFDHLWFLTAHGARTVGDWPEFRGRTVPAPANGFDASLRAAHTHAVTRTHLAFLADAQRRADEYGPLDWLPETAHRLPDTGGDDRLIADALLYYTATAPRRLQYRAFVEVDRATMSSERLARKLIAYARFFDYAPQPVGRRGAVGDQAAGLAWQRFYPRFPRILFVLTGAARPSLGRRIEDLRAMVTGHALVASMASEVPLGAAILDDLEASGPSAAVWSPLAGTGQPCSWMEL